MDQAGKQFNQLNYQLDQLGSQLNQYDQFNYHLVQLDILAGFFNRVVSIIG